MSRIGDSASVQAATRVNAEQASKMSMRRPNGEHRHSAIRFVPPDERHCGREHGILAKRHQFYQRARASSPERWSRGTRNWTPIGLVVLNPPRAEMQAAA